MRISKSPAVNYISLIFDKERVKSFPSLAYEGKKAEVKIRLERSEIERIKKFIEVLEREEQSPTPFERDPMDEAKDEKEYGFFSEFAEEGLLGTS
jgi:hypothetical protein